MRYIHTLEILNIWIVASVATFNSAWAGPPFITDDPEPVEYQHWEVNYAVTESWRQGETSASIPNIDINYGVLPDIQLHVQPRYSYVRTRKASRFGIDGTEVGIKYRILNIQSGDSSNMVGIYPIVQLPNGDTKLGPNRGKIQSLLPIWIQHSNENWTLYGGTGYRINPGTGNKNSLFLGGTALYQVTHDLQFGGEIFHETPDTVEGKSSTGFNLGGNYSLTDNYNMLFSAGKGLNNISSTNQLSLYLGLQVIY